MSPAIGRVLAVLGIALGLFLAVGNNTALAQQIPGASTARPAATAEQPQPGAQVSNPAPSSVRQAANDPQEGYWRTTKHPWEIYLSGITIMMLIFMASLLVLMGWKSGVTTEFQRSFLLLTVIFAALYLIVAGYSDDQTAPVFSLLGAIVGYLFGRAPIEDREKRQVEQRKEEDAFAERRRAEEQTRADNGTGKTNEPDDTARRQNDGFPA
jgi:hypothetical protein